VQFKGNPLVSVAVELSISTRCTRTKQAPADNQENNMAQQNQPNQPQQGNKPGQPNPMPNKPGQGQQTSTGGQQDQSANKK
jgi:hypothetical protein